MIWMEREHTAHASPGTGPYKTSSLCSQNNRVLGPQTFPQLLLSPQGVRASQLRGLRETEPSTSAQEEASGRTLFPVTLICDTPGLGSFFVSPCSPGLELTDTYLPLCTTPTIGLVSIHRASCEYNSRSPVQQLFVLGHHHPHRTPGGEQGPTCAHGSTSLFSRSHRERPQCPRRTYCSLQKK